MLKPVWRKDDKKATRLIILFSIIVFAAILILSRYKLDVNPGFDIHLFAKTNAILNSMVSVLLVAALVAVRNGKFELHKRFMLFAMFLSILFLLSYICHHLFAGETRFGDTDHDGVMNEVEKANAGSMLYVYRILLATHIPLAGLVLPFVLFSAYRGMIGEWARHKKLAKRVWPVWLYVAVSGVVVYLMISPYY